MKQCSKCGLQKPFSDFYKHPRGKFGFHEKCKICHLEMNKIWRENNREQSRIAVKNWAIKNSQRKKETNALYFQNNKVKIRAYRVAYKEANKELIANKNFEYRRNNLAKHSNNEMKRRAAKKQNGIFFINSKELTRIYSSPCAYCGTLSEITADHVIPISRGGTHSIGNLVAACLKCNSSKGSKTITEWKLFSRKGK